MHGLCNFRRKPKFTRASTLHRGIIRAERMSIEVICSPANNNGGQTVKAGDTMKKPLVSVVEDDQFVRESMRRFMRSLGYMVDVFSSAPEFLASPRLNETACLITDVHMPAMTGLELYRRLIDTGRAIPTILVTAFPNDVDRAHALKDGVTCYLGKPVDERDLTRCLDAALASSGSPRNT